jgi:hypothetical protein
VKDLKLELREGETNRLQKEISAASACIFPNSNGSADPEHFVCKAGSGSVPVI